MTNVKQEELRKEIIRIFHGGIHGKGKDGNGYPTYFEKPYYLWVEDRLPVVTSLINQQVIRALEKAVEKRKEGYWIKDVEYIKGDPPKARMLIDAQDVLRLIKEYKGDKG